MHLGAAGAAIASVVFGLGVVAGTVITKQTHPLHFLVLSYALCGLVLLPLALRAGFRGLRAAKRDLLLTFLSRWLPAEILITYGWSLTAGTHATLLVLLEFVFVLLWGHALHTERLQARRLGLAALVLAGGALFIASAGPFGNLALGDLLITAGFALTAYSFFPIQRIIRSVPAVSYIALSLLLTALIFSPAFLLVPFAPTAGSSATIGWPAVSGTDFWLLLLAYVATIAIGFTLWAGSLRDVPAWLVSTILTLQVIAGGLLAWLWLGESLTPLQLAGAALMLIGVWALSRTKPAPERRPRKK